MTARGPNPPRVTRQPIMSTWQASLGLLVQCVTHGTDKAKDQAIAELRRMAELADAYNAEHPSQEIAA